MSKVGFIGVGTMGFPLASNILSKGSDLKFYEGAEKTEYKDLDWTSMFNYVTESNKIN